MKSKLPFWPFLLLLPACASETLLEEPAALDPSAAAEPLSLEIVLVDEESGSALPGEELCITFEARCFRADEDGVVLVERPDRSVIVNAPATSEHPLHTMNLPPGLADVTITMPIMRHDRVAALAEAADTTWEGRTLILARTYRSTLDAASEGAELRLDAADEGPFYLDERGAIDVEADRTGSRGEAVFFADPRGPEPASLTIGNGRLTAFLDGESCHTAWSRSDEAQTLNMRQNSVAVSMPMACGQNTR